MTCWSRYLATSPPNYVQIRTLEQRIEYAKTNVEIQQETLKIVEGGVRAKILNELDLDQARSTLYQTQADIPELESAYG